MNKLKRIGLIFILVTLAFASIRNINAQASTENMKTFFDSKIPGIQIRVNATTETRPKENITAMLSMIGLGDVYIEYFNLSIFGFLNGTYKVMMINITDENFPLNNAIRGYNCTFTVPEKVWGITSGEITLTYRAVLGGLELRFPQMIYGFTMTHVENVYLKTIENQLKSLQALFMQLNETFWDSFHMNFTLDNLACLNRTFWELQQNYTALQGSLNELGNTRMVVGILAVTTVFFVATTLYLVMRKPRESW